MTQATCLDATHFDSKARHWNDNPVFRERGLKCVTLRPTASKKVAQE